MAKRIYCSSVDSVNDNTSGSINKKLFDKAKSATPSVVDATNKPSLLQRVFNTKSKLTMMVSSIIVLIWIVLIVLLVTMLLDYLDIGNGASSPDEAAIGYINSLTDYDVMKKYVPSEIRDEGYVVDNNGLSELKLLDEKYDISLTNINAKVVSSDLNVSDLEKSLADVYHIQVNVNDATKLTVGADLKYRLDGSEQTSSVTFNLISIKSGAKWYIYTADLASDDHIPRGEEDTSREQVVTNDSSTINKPKRELNIYDGVVKDLTSGKIDIDGVQYTFPTPYSKMTGLYTLSDEAIDPSLKTIQPNYILKNLPISFVKDAYGMTEFSVSIGNASDMNIGIEQGLVTTFYIGVPKIESSNRVYDYPTIFLPGNITLMSSYDDVIKVYGNLDKYKGGNASLCLYSNDATVYQLNLNNNEHNRIYFQFVDNKLVAIQYHYYDLTKF